jgi:hypothetical protein
MIRWKLVEREGIEPSTPAFRVPTLTYREHIDQPLAATLPLPNIRIEHSRADLVRQESRLLSPIVLIATLIWANLTVVA